MLIDQLTVCLPDEPGRLAALSHTLGDAGVQIHALMVADTTDFGIIRILCDRPRTAARMLREHGFQATTSQVIAVEVCNVPGGLASVLDRLSSSDLNVEYAYSCSIRDRTVDVIKISGEPVTVKLIDSGLTCLSPQELYSADDR